MKTTQQTTQQMTQQKREKKATTMNGDGGPRRRSVEPTVEETPVVEPDGEETAAGIVGEDAGEEGAAAARELTATMDDLFADGDPTVESRRSKKKEGKKERDPRARAPVTKTPPRRGKEFPSVTRTGKGPKLVRRNGVAGIRDGISGRLAECQTVEAMIREAKKIRGVNKEALARAERDAAAGVQAGLLRMRIGNLMRGAQRRSQPDGE